jgi:hypothetical protein
VTKGGGRRDKKDGKLRDGTVVEFSRMRGMEEEFWWTDKLVFMSSCQDKDVERRQRGSCGVCRS